MCCHVRIVSVAVRQYHEHSYITNVTRQMMMMIVMMTTMMMIVVGGNIYLWNVSNEFTYGMYPMMTVSENVLQ